MTDLKLSDLNDQDVEIVEESDSPSTESAPLSLSDIDDSEVEVIEQPEDDYVGFDETGRPLFPTTPLKEGEISQLESGARGAAQGATLGTADELYAAVRSPFALMEQEMTSPSGRPLLDELKAAYQKERDEVRAANEAAREANPFTYGAGELAGGVASTIALPGGAVAKGASLAQKALAGAKTGATLGGIAGAGYSEADLTEGEVGDFAGDVAKSTAVGGGLGATFPALFSKQVYGKAANPVEAVKQTAMATGLGAAGGATIGAATSDDMIEGAKTGAVIGGGLGLLSRPLVGTARSLGETRFGKDLSKAFAKGQQGEDIASEAYGQKKTKEIIDIGDDVTKEFNKLDEEIVKAKQLADEKALLKTREAEAQALKAQQQAQAQLDKAKSELTENLKAQQKALNEQNYTKFKELNKTLLEKGNKLEDIVTKNQNRIGKGIGDISDDLAASRDIRFNTIDTVEETLSDLAEYSKINRDINVEALAEDLNQFGGEVGYNEYRAFKNYLGKLMKSNDRTVSGIAKKAYGDLNRKLVDSVDESVALAGEMGEDITVMVEKVRTLKDLNRQYTATRELENVIDRARNYSSIGAKENVKSNVGLIRKLSDPRAESIAEVDDFTRLMKQATGQEGEQFIDEAASLSKQLRTLEKAEMPEVFEPRVSRSQVDDLISSDPELQAIREQSKAVPKVEPFKPELTPEELSREAVLKEFKEKFGSKELPTAKRIASMAKKSSVEYDPGTQQDLNAFREVYTKAFGKEKADELINKMVQTSEDFSLGRSTAISPETTQGGFRGLLRTTLGTMQDIGAQGANVLGRAEKSIGDVSKAISKSLQNNNTVKTLSNAAKNKGYDQLASSLVNMEGKDVIGRNAALYMLQQNAETRNQLRELTEELGLDENIEE